MSRIYFDSNVFSNLRSSSLPEYKKLNELLALYKPNLTFFFSHAHIRDKKKDSTEHKFKDFDFMESFTQDNYLSYHALNKNTTQYLATPSMVFNDENEVDDSIHSIFSIFHPDPDDTPEMKSVKGALSSLFNLPLPAAGNLLEGLPEEQQNILSKFVPGEGPQSLMSLIDQQMHFYDTLVTDTQVYKDLRKMIDEGINQGRYTLKKKWRTRF